MAHWTYNDPENAKNEIKQLKQGDILKRTEELKNLMITYHNYYDKYQHFIVLTQSCDLDYKKTGYITLAAIRPIDEFLEKLFDKLGCDPLLRENKIFTTGNKSILYDNLGKLINNTLDEYFFICEDSSCGITEDSVAFLKLSVALKMEHYEECINAKIAELNDIFKAKLGWLVGDMYSRVGTNDWGKFKKDKLSKIIDQDIKWIDSSIQDKLIIAIQKKNESGEKYNIDALIDSIKPKSKTEMFVERIDTIFKENNYNIENDKLKLIIGAISNDSIIKGLIK